MNELQIFLHKFFQLDISNQSNRVYIEVGAFDGISGNTTYFLQQAGWQGILIEPNPNAYQKLLQNRKNTNTYIFQTACVGDDNLHTVKYIQYLELPTHNGISPHPSKIRSEMYHFSKGLTAEEISVSCATLDNILYSVYGVRVPNLMYVQIDTEGTEKDVIKGFNLIKYKPYFICIENDDPRNFDLDDFMSIRGYRIVNKFGHDTLYAIGS